MTNLGVFQIQSRPSRATSQILSLLLFAVCIGLYLQTAVRRHHENPEDRVVPTVHQLLSGVHTVVLEPAEEDDYVAADNASTFERFRHSMLVKDTVASGRRFLVATAL